MCLVIKASAGSRLIGDLYALKAATFSTPILLCQLLLMTGKVGLFILCKCCAG